MKAAVISHEALKAALAYEPLDGTFTWLTGQLRGRQAGCLNLKDGYVQIQVGGVAFKAHRLAWLYVTGEMPEKFIDHLNCCRSDNRFANLRQADPSINSQNRRVASFSTASGRLGVTHRSGKWQARITIKGKVFHIGTFASGDEASDAYVAAKRKFHQGCTL